MLGSVPFTVLADENEVQEIMCTMDSDCMAEIHLEGCPLYSARDTDDEPEQNDEAELPDEQPESPELSGENNESFDDELNSSDNELSNTVDKNDKNKKRDSEISLFSDDSEYAKTIVVEDSKVSSIQAALDSITDDVGGDLLLKINSNIDNKNHKDVISIPTDKGINSLTIGTDIEGGIKESDYYDLTFYANGIPIIIGAGVDLGSHTTIYGGGADDVKSGGTSVTVNEGAAVRTIYGGGHESDVNGDVNIVVNGTVSGVYGGGYVSAIEDDGEKSASANVDGNISITIAGEKSALKRTLAGGGHADIFGDKGTKQTLKANVNGDIEINLDCPNIGSSNEIYGGGIAEIGATFANRKNLHNRIAEANVTGDIDIKLEGGTKAVKNERLRLWGGGYANTSINYNEEFRLENTKVSATVTGDISIDASEDFNAISKHDDWDESMFMRLFGGGLGNGFQATATVYGSTEVKTCRKSIDNSLGAVGGGNAINGGEARVTENTSIHINKASVQENTHDNAKIVIGGGHATTYSDAGVGGSSSVIIDSGILFEPGGFVVGGGYANGSDAVANVSKNTEVVIKGGIDKKIYGGGYAKTTGSSAAVGGNTNISISGNVTEYVYGGGSANGDEADASIAENVNITIDKANIQNWVFCGGYSQNNGKADVINNINIGIKNSESNSVIICGGWSAGVDGKIKVDADDSTLKTLYGGGYLSNSGDIEININNSDIINLYGGGNQGNVDSVEINIDNSDITTLYGSGNQGDSGDVKIILDGATIKGNLYGGGTVGKTTNSVQIDVLGKSNFYLFKTPGTITNGITLNIGDGTTETHAVMDYINDSTSVHIFDNANLEHTPGSDYRLSVSNLVRDLQIDEGGTLIIENYSEEISGNFIGGGTLKMKAGNTLTIGGTVSGQTQVTLKGTPNEDELYIKSAAGGDGSFALKHDELSLIKNDNGAFSEWKTAKGIKVTVADTEHGTVIPSGSFSVAPGAEQTFDFKPEYGYKIGSLKVGGIDVTGQIVDNKYTAAITGECTVEAEFALMEAKDIQDVIEKLPDISPEDVTEEQKESVLETKLHYESLPDDTKAEVPHEELSNLNDALMQLPEIQVEVIIEGDAADTPDSHMLLQSMAVDEAEGLLKKTIEVFKISMKVAEAEGLSDEEQNALEGKVDAPVQKQYDITVNKTVKKSGEDQTSERLTKLSYPVTLVFDVSEELPENGYRREWTVYNIHDDGMGGYTVTALADNDRADETVTVLSNQFSIYALSYKDVKESSGDNRGGGSSYSLDQSSSYRIIVADNIQNGTVKTDRKTSETGKIVTITVQPNMGSRLDTITATDIRGNELRLTGQDGRFEFIMPASDVTVNAEFTDSEEVDILPFTDVSNSDWYYDAVKYVFDNNIMSGTSSTLFSPDLQTTRGMIVTILYRLEGQPKASGLMFGDVAQDMYYTDAVSWASANGIVSGYGNGGFGPDDLITREQLVSVLYRYADFKGIDVSDRADIRRFADAYLVSGYAVEAMEWAYSCGLITGMQDGTLSPDGGAARAQTAAMLMRFEQKFK